MRHTDGPWWACPPDEDSENWEIEDGYGHTATVYGDDEPAAANARLMASAPDLLAACKALAHDIRAMQFTDGEYRLSLASARSILALLDREISKAEGEVINECD